MNTELINQMMQKVGIDLTQPGRDAADLSHGLRREQAVRELTGHAEKIALATLLLLVSLGSVKPAEASAAIAKGGGGPAAKTCAKIKVEVERGNLLPGWLALCTPKKK